MNLRKKLIKRNKGYEYGRHNLIKENFEIVNLENSFKINNFYFGISKVGVCNEQHEKYIQDNPDLNLLRVLGNEPVYFSDDSSNHFYLLAFDKKIPPNFHVLINSNKKEFIEKENPYIVDVSFNTIDRFRNTDYSVKKFLDKFPINKDMEFCKVGKPKICPLGIFNNNLFYIGVYEDKLGVYAQGEYHSQADFVGGFKDTLSCLDKNSDVEKIITSLSSKYKKAL